MVGNWRHLGKYRTEEVELGKVEIATVAEEGGRRRIWVCRVRS